MWTTELKVFFLGGGGQVAKFRKIYKPKPLYMIKRCQDVGLAQEKKLAGADLKHVRGVQSPKQWCTKKKQKKKNSNNHIFEKKRNRVRCPSYVK